MSHVVEHLGKLKRRVTISISKKEIQEETASRIRPLIKKARMPGFRPGKVPLKIVMQQYGPQTEFEVLNDKLNNTFLAIGREENLTVVGEPYFSKKENGKESENDAEQYLFDATFEIYPEVKAGDIAEITITRKTTVIGDAEIDRTIEMLRKQQAHYHERGQPSEHGDGGENTTVQLGDRVTADVIGYIDGQPLGDGFKKNTTFMIGEKQIPEEFEQAALGLLVGEGRTFDAKLPDDYIDESLAGKTAQFTMTIRKIEWLHSPEINADFVKLLGVEDGDIATLRQEICNNLEREAKNRAQALLNEAVMDALLNITELELPEVLVEQEQQRLANLLQENLKKSTAPDITQTPIPKQEELLEALKTLAQRRIKLGLVLNEWVKQHELEAKPEQIRAEVEELAKSYDDPNETLRWYYANRKHLAEVEAAVIERNVVDFVLSKAQVNDEQISFEELANATTR